MSRDFEIYNLSNLTEEELWESVDELKSKVEDEIEYRKECAEEEKAAAIEEKARAIKEKNFNNYVIYKYVTYVEQTYIKSKTIRQAHKLALKNKDQNNETLYWENIGGGESISGYEDRIPIEDIELTLDKTK